MNTFFFGLFASLCGLTNALYIPVPVHHDAQVSSRGTGVHTPAIRLVGAFRQQSDNVNNGSVVNFQDTVYAANMTIGGQEVLIQLDTGSSDLWVSPETGDIEFTNSTDLQADEAYGIGHVSGSVQFANVQLGNHVVPNQAFLNVTNATDFDTIFSNGVRGILGLAFDAGSTVKTTVTQAWGEDSTAGETFLTNLFQQNMTKPFFTMQLGRSGDPSYTTEGAFTIGEYLPEYETVRNMPKLERFPNNGTGAAPRWSTVMSGMTINGEAFQFDPSGVPGTPEGSVVAVLDTGYTYPPIPKNAVDAIYGGIDGAYYDTVNNLWIVPCNKATNLEFQFGEMTVPIHPLDLTTFAQINGTQVCVNTFRASSFPTNSEFDLVLGDAFLKNVYASFNFGNMTAEAVPYIQLMPTTDMDAATQQFDSVRSAMYAQAAASAAASSASASAASAYAALATPCSSTGATTTPLFTSAWSSSAPSAVMTDAAPSSTVDATDSSSDATPTSSADDSSATDPTDDSSSTDASATATSDASDATSMDASSTDASATETSDASTATPTDSSDSSTDLPTDPTATSTDSSADPTATSTDSSDPSATSTDSSEDPSATSTDSSSDPSATSTDSSSDASATATATDSADGSSPTSSDGSGDSSDSGDDSSSTGSLPIGNSDDGSSDGSSDGSGDDGTGSIQENLSLFASDKQSPFANNLYEGEYVQRFRRSYREPTKTVHDCLTPLIESYGALLFALIAGTFVVSLSLCVITVVLAIRNRSRAQARKRAAYLVLEANAAAEADPEAAYTATYHYTDDY